MSNLCKRFRGRLCELSSYVSHNRYLTIMSNSRLLSFHIKFSTICSKDLLKRSKTGARKMYNPYNGGFQNVIHKWLLHNFFTTEIEMNKGQFDQCGLMDNIDPRRYQYEINRFPLLNLKFIMCLVSFLRNKWLKHMS